MSGTVAYSVDHNAATPSRSHDTSAAGRWRFVNKNFFFVSRRLQSLFECLSDAQRLLNVYRIEIYQLYGHKLARILCGACLGSHFIGRDGVPLHRVHASDVPLAQQ